MVRAAAYEDRAGLDGESFGRLPSLTHQIRELIHDYPEGVGIIKELIQNADDAGARTLRLIVDFRSHSTAQLPSPSMAALQGPALLVYNDSTFTDDDFKRIQEIYRSGKVHAAEKTGQFGKGFNTVYNVTDFPGFVTGDRIAFFDPHGAAVHNTSREHPGRTWRLADCWKNYPDLLRPFSEAGLSPGQTHFSGTIFRLPFRTPERAGISEISRKPFGEENVVGLFTELVGVREGLLLFLKNLESLSVFEVRPTTGTPRELLVVETLNPDEIRPAREVVLNALRGTAAGVVERLQASGSVLQSYRHQFRSRWAGATGTGTPMREAESEWRIVSGLFLDDEGAIAEAVGDFSSRDMKAVPLGGAAARIDGRPGSVATKGKAYCALPLPVETGLQVHLNGYFDLDSSRHSLTTRAGLSGNSNLRARWNELLVEHVVSQVYARLIEALAADIGDTRPKEYYGRWPGSSALSPPFDALPQHVYRHLEPLSVVRAAGETRWLPISEAKVFPTGWEGLTPALVAEGAPVPDPPLPTTVVSGFEAGGVEVKYIRPNRFRNFLQVTQPFAGTIESGPRSCLQKREWVEGLLRFVLSDGPSDLTLLPLAVTANGQLRTFGPGAKGEPLFVAGTEERELFSSRPGWFLDEEFVTACGLGSKSFTGCKRMGPAEVVEWLPALLPAGSTLDRTPGKAGPPGVTWLIAVYRYLTGAVQRGFRPLASALQKIAMVPDQQGRLLLPGYVNTPLLGKESAGNLRTALERFGVPLVTAPADLFDAIMAFAGCCGCNFVWKLTGPDLVDTLANAGAGNLPPFQRATYGPLIDFLALPRWRSQGTSYSAGQREKLKALPLFPSRSSGAVRLDTGAVIPGDFTPPPTGAALTQLDLGEDNRWRAFLAYLGVPVLGRAAFIKDHLLDAYKALDPGAQLTALRWVRDNLNAAVSEREIEGDVEGFMDAVRQAPLIRCEDGKCRPAADTYDPAFELVRELLGNAAAFPNVEFYAVGIERWLPFFRELGMADRVRARDILGYVDRLTAEANRAGAVKVVARVVKVFQYLDESWAELGQDTVDDFGTTLAEALSERAWLPAERQRLGRWPGAAVPEMRLFRPGELYLQPKANLVASQAPILSVSRVGAEIRAGLGFPEDPALEVVLDHFDRLITLWEGARGEPADKVFEAAFGDIYRFLSAFDETEEGGGLAARFRDRPCLWHDGRLWPAKHVFRAKVASYFGPRRATVAVKGVTRQAYQLLGLRERPSTEDFLEYIAELSQSLGGKAVPPAEMTRLLTLYHRMVEGWGDDDAVAERFPLLAADGRLVKADAVFFNDAPWFAERVRPGAIHLLHSGLPIGIRRLSWVRSLAANVTERPVGSWPPSDDGKATDRAAVLTRVIRSEEFRRGMARLITHRHGTCRPAELNWLARATVQAVAEIQSELVVELDGRQVVVGSGQASHYCDPRKRTFYLEGTAGRLMARHLADAIDCQLDHNRLSDLANLLLILEGEPEEIDPLLTQLRIKPLEAEPTFIPVDDAATDEVPSDEADGTPDPWPDAPAGDDVNPEWTDGPEPADAFQAPTPSPGRNGSGGSRSGVGGSDSTESPLVTPTVGGTAAPAVFRSGGRGGHSGAGRLSGGIGAKNGQSPGPAAAEGSPASDSNGRSGSVRQSHRSGPRDRRRNGNRVATYVSGTGPDGDSAGSTPPTEEQRQQKIAAGENAVARVLEFERQHGREPTRLSEGHPGYDAKSPDPRVESVEPATGTKRLIEVKGVRGAWTRQGVALSSHQFRAAREFGDRFWLYVVEFADDPAHALVHPIRDPFARITEFWFDRGWRQLSDPAESPSASVRVEAGTRLEVEGQGVGTVSEVIERGALKVVVIRLDSGSELKRPFNPRTMKTLGGV